MNSGETPPQPDRNPLLHHRRPLMPTLSAAVALDHNGTPATRGFTGGWTSALFIIAVEIGERFAYYGVSANLISYLTGPLGESTAGAAVAVNIYTGVSTMLPLIGAAVADASLGRYRTIVLASALYVVGLCLLAVSTIFVSSDHGQCGSIITYQQSCRPTLSQVAFFYVSLYIVAIAQGGHKPCTQAFGADQFDPNDQEESVSRSSFFNWWYFGICFGTAFTLILLSYIQDNIGWGLGFGIPCIVMFFALVVFLFGTRTYRYYALDGIGSFVRIGKAFKALVGDRKSRKAKLKPDAVDEAGGSNDNAELVEEARAVIRLIPIWVTCLIYAVVFAQSQTFFTKQAATLDRRIGSNFQVPPAALQSFISITIVICIPLYDQIIVPTARRFTHLSSGITMLQRIGTGIVLSFISMVIAALVEAKRLEVAKEYGLVDKPKTPIPMSLWWVIPQYILFGLADVFTMVGLQEFFYDQVPAGLRSLGLALYLSIFGVGGFISSFLISVVNAATSSSGQGWFPNNLNQGHLDYFYWLLAGLSAVAIAGYILSARVYVYRK